MREHVINAIQFIFLIVAIVVAFSFYKAHNRVVVKTGDDGMLPEYAQGSYGLRSDYDKAADLAVGVAVAYHPPGKPEEEWVGWVVAREGQKVQTKPRGTDTRRMYLWVDGQESALQSGLTPRQPMPEIVIPRNCVFVIRKDSGKDSFTFGPIPLRLVKGRMK
ncbi:MAG: hypothetical protein AMXMBFR7_25200 [Planctomycetota bacterium]